LPLRAKEESGAGNHCYPQHRAEKIEDYEGLPRHSQGSRKWSCDDAHTEDETGKENGHRSMATKEFFPLLNGALTNTKYLSVPQQQWPSAAKTQVIPYVVSQSCRHSSKEDYVLKLQFVFRKGEKSSKQQNSLARDRNAGIFEQQHNGYCPVAILSEI